MYHNNELTQVFLKEKSLISKVFSQQHSQPDHFRAYLRTCTPTQQRIGNIIYNFKNAPFIKLKNEYIARQAGCSIATVQRATRQFTRDGFITKSQDDIYAPNSYRILVDHTNKIVCLSEYDTPNKRSSSSPSYSSLIVDSLCSKSMYVSSRARDLGRFAHKKRGFRVNHVQKKMIINNKNDARLKDILNHATLGPEIVTSMIKSIGEVLALQENERFKFVAFDDETLEHVFDEIGRADALGKMPQPHKRLQWALDFGLAYCALNKLKPDWTWYYELCKITGMDTSTYKQSNSAAAYSPKSSLKSNDLKRVVIPKALQGGDIIKQLERECKQRKDRIALYSSKFEASPYDKKVIVDLEQQLMDLSDGKERSAQKDKQSPWKTMQKFLPLEARVQKWRTEISKLEQQLNNYPQQDPYHLKGVLIRNIYNAKQELIDAELLLKESYESEELLYQHSTNIMATISA